jgi:hypothetical protein
MPEPEPIPNPPEPIPAAPAETAQPPANNTHPEEEHTPMLDVHPAHHAASTWKEFFIHIATIVLGLCIAVGLEQLVEHIHHRIELADARKALAIERKINIVRFSAETQEFHRFVPILQNDLAIFVYLRRHPGKPLPPSLGTLRWRTMTITMLDSAWTAAQHSGVVDSMPQSEARKNSQLYARLNSLNQAIHDAHDAVDECQRFRIVDPDPAHLSPEQLDRQIDLISRALFAYRNIAFIMVNTHENIPDLTPSPSRADLSAITHAETQSADDRRDAEATQRELKTARDYVRSLDQNESPE